MAPTPQQKPGTELVASTVEDLKEEIGKEKPAATSRAEDAQVKQWVERLLELDPEDVKEREQGKGSVETMGLDLQRQSARVSQMLRKPITTLSKRADDGGDVGKSLVDLQVAVERLDPGRFNFEPGWFGRMVGSLPGVGTPLRRYFGRYQSVQTVIDAILRSLERGRDELSRDIVTLNEDQKRMRDCTKKLQQTITLAEKLDAELQARLDGGSIPDDKRQFVSEELLFPLRQRILDLQQQLAVNQQGVIASELIVRNNKELVRGVNRALNVTSTALQVGATVALALESQKRVLDKMEATSKTTSDLIAGTAARLKTQGTEIQKQAAGTVINIDSLKNAFRDLNDAMNEISRFRQEALPQMAQSVLDFDQLTREGEEAIARMEAAKTQRESVLVGPDGKAG